MTNIVKNAGRKKYMAARSKHDQRTPLPPRAADARATWDAHMSGLRSAAGRPAPTTQEEETR